MSPRRAALVLSVLALLAPNAVTAAQAGPAHAEVTTTQIGMRRFAYEPPRSEIRAGTIVEWTYYESMLDPYPNCESVFFQIPGSPVSCGGHSATAWAKGQNGKPLFDSGVHRADGFPFRVALTVPGVFRYYCTIHAGPDANNPVTDMQGVVIAQPPVRGIVADADDVAGQLDVRSFSATRSGSGVTVSVTTYQGWTTSQLAPGTRNSITVGFDLDTDGALGANDVVAKIVYAGGKLTANLSGAGGSSKVAAVRLGSTGVRFTVPSSSPVGTGPDHQVSVSTRAVYAVDRAPAFPGWIPLLAG
jgi:plastocyanin